MSSQQWYVKVDNRAVGPLSTDLVLRGLADGELPPSALVCRAGAYSWLPVSAVPTFSTGSARPLGESTAAAGSVPPASGCPARREICEAYEAVNEPGGLRVAADRPGVCAGAPDGEDLAEGHAFGDGPPDGAPSQAAGSASEPAETAVKPDSVIPTQVGGWAQQSPSPPIRPTFTLSVSQQEAPPGPGTGAGPAEMPHSGVPEADASDSGRSGQSRDRHSSITVTAQVVLSERVNPSQLQPIRAMADSEPSSAGRRAETLSLVDRIEAGAWRLEQVPGPSVPTGQTAVIDPIQQPADPARTQRLQAQELPTALRDNPFMSQRPAEPETSASMWPDGVLASGRNGNVPRVPEATLGSEIERSAEAFDWSQQFCGYFEMGESFELPDQRVLVQSLQLASLDVLVQPEAMWNLAVCLALGSDALAAEAAGAFFRIMVVYPNRDRLEWMARVLLSRGFLPSGIPLPAGQRAVRLLQAHCPPELRSSLSQALAG